MKAAKDKHAFYVAYDMPGLTVGVAGNSEGKLFSIQSEQPEEKEKGSITPGKLADMVLLSDDIFSIVPEKIRDVRALKTFVGGRLVYFDFADVT